LILIKLFFIFKKKFFYFFVNSKKAVWIQNILMNPLFPFQLIHPIEDTSEYCFEESDEYMFLNEKFDLYEKDPFILNVNPMDGKRPFFYE
jgi:hypothetical protein